MSDLTFSVGTDPFGRRTNNPNENHEAVPLDLSEKNRLKSPICAFGLRFSAAC
jgi:hypothetical protein